MNKTSSDAEDSDVPPLEDMSGLLQQAQQLQQAREKEKKKKETGSREPDQSGDSPGPPAAARSEQGPHTGQPTTNGAGACSSDRTKENDAYSSPKPKPVTKPSNSFGGMKKGFLFGGPPKSAKPKASAGKRDAGDEKHTKQNDVDRKSATTAKTKTTSTDGQDDIPLIKPRAQGDGARSGAQKIPEVQEAMKASAPFLQGTDWVTEDLLAKFEKHPRLMHQMSDPRFAQAITMFQTDPKGAMLLFQDNPEFQTLFKDFCDIMGDHFSQLSTSDSGSSSGSPSQRSPLVSPVAEPSVRVRETPGADMTVAAGSTDSRQPTASDEARMRDIMTDPAVRTALADPRTVELFGALRTDPDRAQEMMRTADAQLRGHIKTLVDKGLLGFAR